MVRFSLAKAKVSTPSRNAGGAAGVRRATSSLGAVTHHVLSRISPTASAVRPSATTARVRRTLGTRGSKLYATIRRVDPVSLRAVASYADADARLAGGARAGQRRRSPHRLRQRQHHGPWSAPPARRRLREGGHRFDGL